MKIYFGTGGNQENRANYQICWITHTQNVSPEALLSSSTYSTCTCKHYVSFSSVTIVTKFPVHHSLTAKPSSPVTINNETDIPSNPWRLCVDHTHTQQCSNSGIHRWPIPLKNTSCHLRTVRDICCHGAYNNQRRYRVVPCTAIFFMPQCISTLGPSLVPTAWHACSDIIQSTMWLWRHHQYPPTDDYVHKKGVALFSDPKRRRSEGLVSAIRACA